MRNLCPNLDNEDGLDTVLEVPVPEELFASLGNNSTNRWSTLRQIMRNQGLDKSYRLASGSNNEFLALLKLVGTPLIPFQVHNDLGLNRPIRDCSIVSFLILDRKTNPRKFLQFSCFCSRNAILVKFETNYCLCRKLQRQNILCNNMWLP